MEPDPDSLSVQQHCSGPVLRKGRKAAWLDLRSQIWLPLSAGLVMALCFHAGSRDESRSDAASQPLPSS